MTEHEDLLFGVALFFEGLSVLYAGQDELVDTYRRQCRNVIQNGKEVVMQAMTLLEKAQADPSQAAALESFTFALGEGHPQPDELARRARILVDTYNREFAGRSRSQAFSHEETIRLIDAAAEAF